MFNIFRLYLIFFYEENASFENVVCKMAAILLRLQGVNNLYDSHME